MEITITPKFSFSPSLAYTTGRRKLRMVMTRQPQNMKNVEVYIGDHKCKKLRRHRRRDDVLRCRIPKIQNSGDYSVTMFIDSKPTIADNLLTINAFNGSIEIANSFLLGS